MGLAFNEEQVDDILKARIAQFDGVLAARLEQVGQIMDAAVRKLSENAGLIVGQAQDRLKTETVDPVLAAVAKLEESVARMQALAARIDGARFNLGPVTQ